jgi:amino acid adenylation domain-containing protein
MMGFLIHSALEHHAVSSPQHPALSLKGVELSYSSLNEKSNQLAHTLLNKSVVLEDRIGIYMHKSLELGVAIYGILKAGCAFVPLDPFLPADRLQFIIDDCDIRHIVSSDALLPTLEGLDVASTLNVYGVESQASLNHMSWSDIERCSVASPEVVMIDQSLGYIMYTSGSTGSPKGMMHTHVGSNTYALWGANYVGMTPQDRVASHAPLHFDLSIFDFFSTAMAGATVVLVPETVARFPASWSQLIDSERISIVFTVPYTLITMFLQGALEKRDLNSLRWVLFGGEPYPPEQLRKLMLRLGNTKFTNVYGPAEAPSCVCFDVPLPDENSDEPIPIGIVSVNSTDIVIDENDDDCVTGVPGELCIRSTSLTRGYWNRPDLNDVAYLFRASHGPFPQVYFRTGDRVVRGEDGLLRFLGRIGRMVKTRGHRVELDEIEFVLSKIDGVSEVAAYAVPDGTGSQTVLAAVSSQTAQNLDEGTLLQYARKKLPIYAVPRHIRILEKMPHTSTGKIDRQALCKQSTDSQNNSGKFI